MLKKIVAGLMLSCSISAAALAQEPKMGGVINAVIQPEPPSLMLAQIQNGPTQMVAGNIYEGLLRYSPKLEPQPGLAESWTISDDAKVYTFHLKKGVTWHDGKPFTSADVLFSIDMLKQTPCARARQPDAGRESRGARRLHCRFHVEAALRSVHWYLRSRLDADVPKAHL